MELAIQKDCQSMIESFIANENPRFESFVDQWKSTLFHNIYSGQSLSVEIIQSTNACLHYAKRNFSSKSTLHKLGALFLLYAIYFKQPTDRFNKIDVDLTTWQNIKEFVFSSDIASYGDGAKCIFWLLLKENAFRFVGSDIYYGLENLLNLDKIRSNHAILSTSIQTFRNDIKTLATHRGLFGAIEKLDDGYREMKELISQNTSSENQCIVPVSKGFQDLKKALSKLEALVDGYYNSTKGKKRKKKERKAKKGGIEKTRLKNISHLFHKKLN